MLAACGGGGGPSADVSAGGGVGTGPGTAATPAVSSGAITAFGSVFVNGHEFATTSAMVVDDDTQATSSSTTGLEVGMAVDVKASAQSTDAHPDASEIHVHPLARGAVDASTLSSNTITVMGQTIQLSSATVFSDHRACVNASVSPCAAVTGQSGLVASGTTPGTYVSVDGYLYASGTPAAGANVVATLVAVRDVPTSASPADYKVEGVVTATGAASLTIGGLSVNLSGATCFANGATASCTSAFTVGQVVSVFSATSPTLPAVSFNATTAIARPRLLVETTGASVELEGSVSSVVASPASFVVRGVTIDASALASTPLLAVGDRVRVVGTIANGGTSITATSFVVTRASAAASVDLEGDVTSVAAGAAANTDAIVVLGQTIAVTSSTWLADRSLHGDGHTSASGASYNFATFQTYLAASASQHVVVRAIADPTGALTALSVAIFPASTHAGVAGVVDATPAPINSSTTGTATTFSIHGIAVHADPASIVKVAGGHGSFAVGGTISAGDAVLARGIYSGMALTVAAPSGSAALSSSQIVVDEGAPSNREHDGF
jgi:hypothetical protein